MMLQREPIQHILTLKIHFTIHFLSWMSLDTIIRLFINILRIQQEFPLWMLIWLIRSFTSSLHQQSLSAFLPKISAVIQVHLLFRKWVRRLLSECLKRLSRKPLPICFRFQAYHMVQMFGLAMRRSLFRMEPAQFPRLSAAVMIL